MVQVYLRPALRTLGTFLLLHFAMVTLAPGWVVADFLLERGRIARELCMQRMVPGDMRTCHGECQLKKRLERNDEQEKQVPAELRVLRMGEMTAGVVALTLKVPTNGTDQLWPELEELPLGGHTRPLSPVPWC